MRIGVLALQGAFIEHEKILSGLGAEVFEIRQKSDFSGQIDGLVIPGGESTVMGKLLRELGLFDPVKKAIAGGLPTLGTCAGLILLAKEIEGESPHLATMDIAVRRNAYGRQIDSFIGSAVIEEFSPKEIELVFIRAPWIERTFGRAKTLATLDGHIIAARQDNMLAVSFPPELTDDPAVHEYFLRMVKEYKKK